MVLYPCPHPFLPFHPYPQLANLVPHLNQQPSIHINFTSITAEGSYTPFFSNLSNPSSLTFFVPLFLRMNVTSCHTCVILLTVIMNLNLLSLGTLVAAAPCCVFNATRHEIYWRLHMDDRVFANTLIWYYCQRNTHMTHRNQ